MLDADGIRVRADDVAPVPAAVYPMDKAYRVVVLTVVKPKSPRLRVRTLAA